MHCSSSILFHSSRAFTMFSMSQRIRTFIAMVALLAGIGGVNVGTQSAAQAYPWDPHVRVLFNISNCAGASGLWGWYEGDGESGWVQWNAGYQGSFDLYHVSTSGSVTSIKWGPSGSTCNTRYFNITRPTYGNNVALGWIG